MREALARLRARPVISNVLALLSGSLLGQLFMAAATLLTARLLGAAAFGQYAACFALASLTATAFTFGMDGWLLQQGRHDRATLNEQLTNSLALRVLLGLPWFLVVIWLAPRLNPTTYPPGLILVVATTVWLDGLLGACLASFKASLRNHLTSALVAVGAASLLAATLALARLEIQGVIWFAAARALISLLLVVGTVGALAARGTLRLRPTLWRATLRAALPFALSELLYLVYLKADVTIIAARLDEAAVGQYAPAANVVGALFLVPSAIFMVMVPVLGKLLHPVQTGAAPFDPARVRRLLVQLAVGVAAVGTALTLGTALVGPPLLRWLLGAEFGAAGGLLRIMSLLLFFKAGTFGAAAVLVAADWQAQRVHVQAVVALLNVTLNLLLVQQIGIVGVAWIYVLTEGLLFAGYGLQVGRWWRRQQRAAQGQPTFQGV